MKNALFSATALFCLAGDVLLAQSAAIRPSPPNPLDDFSNAVERLVQRTAPAVLQVVTEGFSGGVESGGNAGAVSRQTGVASCVAVSADGDLITSAHVLNGVRRVRVRLDGHEGAGHGTAGLLVDAKIVGVDRETDLALLKLDRPTPQHLELADSSLLRQGQLVFALGNPQGLNNSASMGVVSAVSRGFGPDASQSFIQTDAPINPGSSGGPLINTQGQVVGIDTFILTESGGSEGLGFAIPSDLVRDVYAQLKKYGRVRRGEIGVVVRSVTPTIAGALGLPRHDGVLIQDVQPQGTALAAGLKADDIVISVEGRPVRNVRQLSNSLFRSEIGETLALEVVRGDKNLTLHVALDEHSDATEILAQQVRDRATPIPQLGVLVVPLDAALADVIPDARPDSGSVVAAKLQTTSAVQEELEVGDVIVGINGKPATGVAPLQELLNAQPEDGPLVAHVQRNGLLRYFLIRGE